MTLDSRFVFGLQQVCHGFSLFFGTQCGCLCGPAGYGLEFQCAEDGFQILTGNILDIHPGDVGSGEIRQFFRQ